MAGFIPGYFTCLQTLSVIQVLTRQQSNFVDSFDTTCYRYATPPMPTIYVCIPYSQYHCYLDHSASNIWSKASSRLLYCQSRHDQKTLTTACILHDQVQRLLCLNDLKQLHCKQSNTQTTVSTRSRQRYCQTQYRRCLNMIWISTR